MWVIAVILSLAQAQPPCGSLGEAFERLVVSYAPSAPSFLSTVQFNITGFSSGFSGLMTLGFRLTSLSTDLRFAVESPNSFEIRQDASFNLSLSISLPGAWAFSSGWYQYHVDFWVLEEDICVQETVGDVAIGTTVSFAVMKAIWAPVAPSPLQPASLLIQCQNTAAASLNVKECQMMLIPSGVYLETAGCEMSDISPAGFFSVSAEILSVPALPPGNYTVQVSFASAVQLGHVELALQIAGTSPLSFQYNADFASVTVTNESEEELAFVGVFTQIGHSSNGTIWTEMQAFTLKPGAQWSQVPFPAVLFVNSSAEVWVLDSSFTMRGCFVVDLVVQPPCAVTSFTVNSVVTSVSDILLLYVQGCSVQSLSYYLLSYEAEIQVKTYELWGNNETSSVLSLPLLGLYSTGNYLLCAFPADSSPYAYVTLELMPAFSNPWSVLNIEYTPRAQLTAGGIISITANIEGQQPTGQNATCNVVLSNKQIIWGFGTLDCSIAAAGADEYLLQIPVLFLPAYAQKSAAFLIEVDYNERVNATDVAGSGYFQQTVYWTFPDQITPTNMSVFPTTITAHDSLTVALAGEKTPQTADVAFQSAALYSASAKLPLNCTYIASSAQYNNDSFEVVGTLSANWPESPDTYSLQVCVSDTALNLYCWRTDITVISEPRLLVTQFAWNTTLGLANNPVPFSFAARSLSLGNFDQQLCLVSISAGARLVASAALICEAQFCAANEEQQITAIGRLALPSNLTPGTYQVSVDLRSSAQLANGNYCTTLPEAAVALWIGWLLVYS